jgi:hypothetical protein
MKPCAGTACLLGVLLLVGCVDDDAGRAMRYQRRQFHAVMEGKLRQIDHGIARLGSARFESDSTYAGEVENLKRRQRTLRERLAAMDAATDQQWPALQDSVQSDYRGVREQYAALVSREARATAVHRDSLESARHYVTSLDSTWPPRPPGYDAD